MPVVQVLRRLGRRDNDHVGADFRLGMTLAAEHLIRLGHRRIAFVGGGRHASPARDRAHAYRETLTRYGLPIGPIVNCLPTREEGERAVERLMRGGANDPTAIICHNDLCAIGVLVGLSDRGLVAGKDCAVIGFDNIPEAAHSRPALTTIDIGARQIGDEAAKLLLRRIKAPDGAPESIVLPPRLIIRSSCGGQSAQDQSTHPALTEPGEPRDKVRRNANEIETGKRNLLVCSALDDQRGAVARPPARADERRRAGEAGRRRATPVRKPNGRGRPRRPSRMRASRSSFSPATSRTTSRISMAST